VSRDLTCLLLQQESLSAICVRAGEGHNRPPKNLWNEIEIAYTPFMNSTYQLQPIGKWTLEYLQELPSIELDWLDYKASAWLKIDSITFEEFSKYLSAYANFDGGYLIIGATNPTPGNPLQLDGGVDFTLKNGIQGWS
jgi:hypothetical protein